MLKRRILLVTLILIVLVLSAYSFFVSAVDFFISGSGSYYLEDVVWETTLNGTATNNYFGTSVATGDVNGDGYVDVIVGSYAYDLLLGPNGGGEQAFVFFGTADGISDMDASYANLTFNGTGGDGFGGYVASGDVNNDSYDDVIVGAFFADPPGGSNAGQVFVLFGADYTETINQNASLYANITLNGSLTNEFFGWSVASGDINNDTYVDVIVGALYGDPPGGSDAGQAFVFFGADYTTAINENAWSYANITLNGTKASDEFGHSVASGDINNDSYADVIVGARYATPPGTAVEGGQAYVFFGTDYTTAINEDALSYANITLNGTRDENRLGYSVASGDVNNDSYSDVITGVSSGVSTSYEGQVLVFFGADYTSAVSYEQTHANVTLNGTTTNGYLGVSVASGDVNNDNYTDVIAGAYGIDSNAGQAYVFFGADYNSAINEDAWSYANITLNGTAASDTFSFSVASGDINNDSYANVIVGAPQADPPGGSGAGIVYIFAFDDVYPVISLDGPADFYNETATGYVVFNYTANDTHLDYCELWGNWTGSWHMNESFVSPASGETNGSSNITIEDGLYVWAVYCNDTANNYNNTVGNRTLVVDVSTAPIVSLEEPDDFFNETATGNVTFNYTATDLTELETCELWGNWTGTWHMNESFVNMTKDITNGSSNVTIEDGLYVWSVYCNDTQGNSNTTVENRTLTVDLTSPSVTLDAPSDDSYDTDGDVNFSFTAVEANPDQCTLWFRSNATNWAQNDSTTYSNNVQANIFVNLTDAAYVWNVECNGTENQPTFSSANRTLTVDTVVPTTPTVTEPSDTNINPKDSISYTCQSTDATAGISSWAWTLTKPGSTTVTKTGGEVTSNSQTFSGDDTNLAGTYTVKCEVEDKAGWTASNSKTFAVYYSHYVAAPSAGPSAAAKLDFTLQEEIKIKEKQGVIMTFTLDGTAIHRIKLKKVTTKTVTIVIESEPIEITLEIGETKEVDVDGDGVNDISITLNDIKEGIADITTKRLAPLSEEVPEEEMPPEEAPPEIVPPVEEAPSKAGQLIFILVVLVVAGLIYYYIKRSKHKIKK